MVNIARTMIIESNLPQNFWAEAVNTACHVTNRCLIRVILNKTPYELLNNRKPMLSYLRAFGCKCFVLNNGKDDLGKNLILRVMEEYLLDILHRVRLTEYSTNELNALRKAFMLYLMKMEA